MKIILLTIWHVKNYGAEMQAYATIKALKELGYEVNIIDFRLSDRSNLTLKNRIGRIIQTVTIEQYKFRKFWKKYFSDISIRYKSMEELKKRPPSADMYLVGSDQVWNEEITQEKASIFYLYFGEDNMIRASYASSFGVNSWNYNEKLEELAKKQFAKFSYISCRENSGVNILDRVFGMKGTRVLDPTLLYTGYPELTGILKHQNTLVYYPLSDNRELESFSKYLADKMNLRFVNANKTTLIMKKIIWNRPSVEEWIKTIAQASMVVTPSFHGLAFSLIYHKQFIVVKSYTNSKRFDRLTDLLNELGLTSRCFNNITEIQQSQIWLEKINYSLVDERLAELRKKSFNYLSRFSNEPSFFM